MKTLKFHLSMVALLSVVSVCGGAAAPTVVSPAATSSSSRLLPVFTTSPSSQPTLEVPIDGAYQLCAHKTMQDLETFVTDVKNSCSASTLKQACFAQMQYSSQTKKVTLADCPKGYLELMRFGTAVTNLADGKQVSAYDQDIQYPVDTNAVTFYSNPNNGYTCGISALAPAVYVINQEVRGEWPAAWGGKSSWVNNGNTDCHLAYCYPRKPDQVILLPVGTNPANLTSKVNVDIGTRFSYQGKVVQVTSIVRAENCVNKNTGVGLTPPMNNSTCTYKVGIPDGGSVPDQYAWHIAFTYTTQQVVCTRPAGYYPANTSVNNPNSYPLPAVSPTSYNGTIKICSKRVPMYEIRDDSGAYKSVDSAEAKCAENSPGTPN